MINDEVWTTMYNNAIINNRHLFNNKNVMDIGSGTGILSLMCAKADSKLVYSIEASNIFKVAKKIFKENKYNDKIKLYN